MFENSILPRYLLVLHGAPKIGKKTCLGYFGVSLVVAWCSILQPRPYSVSVMLPDPSLPITYVTLLLVVAAVFGDESWGPNLQIPEDSVGAKRQGQRQLIHIPLLGIG